MNKLLYKIVFARLNPKFHPFIKFALNLGILTLPALLLLSILRSNPSIQSTMSLSFPAFHLGKLMMISAQEVLAILGYNAILTFETNIYHYGVFALQIGTGVKVFLGFSCLGLGVMLVYTALIVAWPGSFRIKVPYILFGLILIFVLNVSRMSYLTWLSKDGTNFTKKTISILGIRNYDHHDLFNFFIYIVIFLLFILWVEVFSKIKPGQGDTL